MNVTHKPTIYGEPVEDLLPGLFVIMDAMTLDPDGMYSASFTLGPKDGAPLKRALLRVEAELLSEDAASVGCRYSEIRTHGQRGADALIRLVQAVGFPVVPIDHRDILRSASRLTDMSFRHAMSDTMETA